MLANVLHHAHITTYQYSKNYHILSFMDRYHKYLFLYIASYLSSIYNRGITQLFSFNSLIDKNL